MKKNICYTKKIKNIVRNTIFLKTSEKNIFNYEYALKCLSLDNDKIILVGL